MLPTALPKQWIYKGTPVLLVNANYSPGYEPEVRWHISPNAPIGLSEAQDAIRHFGLKPSGHSARGRRAVTKMTVKQAKQVLYKHGYSSRVIDAGGDEVWWHKVYGPDLSGLSMRGKFVAMRATALKAGQDREAAAWETLALAARGRKR